MQPHKKKFFSKRIFFLRIILPTFITIALFSLSLFYLIVPQFEKNVMERKREMITELTNSAWSILEEYNDEVKRGTLSIEEAKNTASLRIEYLRYGKERKDYFWITDTIPNMIMHPYKSDLNGKNLSEFVDSRDNQMFTEMADVVKKQEHGFVDYLWQWKDDSARIVPKLSYVMGFKPWGWILGTGIYIDDVEEEISEIKSRLIKISLGITLLISLFLAFIARQSYYFEKKRRTAENELKTSREKYKTLVEASTEGVLMILGDEIVYSNNVLQSLTGYSDEEFTDVKLEKIFCLNEIQKKLLVDSISGSYEERQSIRQFETFLLRKDNSQALVFLTISPILFFEKRGIIIVVKDIGTEVQKAEELKRKEEINNYFGKLNLGKIKIDLSDGGKIISLNELGKMIFGIEKSKLENTVSIFDFISNKIEVEKIFKELRRNKQIINKKVEIIKFDKSDSIINLSMFITDSPNEKDLICEGIIEDISCTQRKLEEVKSKLERYEKLSPILELPVKEFAEKIMTCSINQSVDSVLSRLIKQNQEIIAIESDAKEIIGFVSMSDLIHNLYREEVNTKLSLSEIMSDKLDVMSEETGISEAINILSSKNIFQILLKDKGGNINCVFSPKDLVKAFSLNLSNIIKKVDAARSVEELIQFRAQVNHLISLVSKTSDDSKKLTNISSLFSDSIHKKLASIVFKELGEPPVKFTLIVLGSEGREEQTLATDQDNALIYEDVPAEEKAEAEKYFLNFGDRITFLLNEIGYNYCHGKVMASNPKWCQPISVWKKYFTEWVTTANPQDLLEISIFFDFKYVFGNHDFTLNLTEHVRKITTGYNSFFVYLSENCLKVSPSFSKTSSSLSSSGKEYINVKMTLLPIIDLVRTYALKNKIYFTNTFDRIRTLFTKRIFSEGGYQEIKDVYNFLMMLRFKHQLRLIAENKEPNNEIYLSELEDWELDKIKKVFNVISDFQAKLKMDFIGTLTF